MGISSRKAVEKTLLKWNILKHPWIPNIHGFQTSMVCQWHDWKGRAWQWDWGYTGYTIFRLPPMPDDEVPIFPGEIPLPARSLNRRVLARRQEKTTVDGWSLGVEAYFFGAAVFFFVSGHPESCLKILSLGEVFFWMSFWPQKSWFSGGSLFISGSARGFMMGWDEQINRWKWFLNISNSHQSSSGGDAKNRDFWQTQYTQSEASFRAWIMQQLT